MLLGQVVWGLHRAHGLRAGSFKGIGFLPPLPCEMERAAFVKGIFRCGLLGGILGGRSWAPRSSEYLIHVVYSVGWPW